MSGRLTKLQRRLVRKQDRMNLQELAYMLCTMSLGARLLYAVRIIFKLNGGVKFTQKQLKILKEKIEADLTSLTENREVNY